LGTRSARLEEFGDDFGWSMLEAVPDAMIMASTAGDIVFANERAGTMFATSSTDLVGRIVEDLLPESMRKVHRADRTRYRAEPTVRPMGVGLDLLALRLDGTAFPVEISLSPVWLGGELYVLVAVRDITARVQADDRLHRVLKMLDATDDAMFIFDADTLRYSFVNAGAERLVGYSSDELRTMTPLHLNPDATDADYRTMVATLLSDPTRSLVRRASLLRRDGSEVPVEKTYQVGVTGSDGSTWVIGVARNIGERLAAEAELRASQEALQEAEREVAVGEDRERIARDLHDTVIQRLFGEGLRLEAVVPRVDESVRGRIESVVEGLDQTIKELRMAIFSLQSTGAAPGGLRGRLLDEVTAATDALEFEPRLQFDGAVESIDDRVAEHLIPVLREALSNVARHAEASQVRVAVKVDDQVTLTVTDDGVGVPDEVLGGHGLANLADRARALGGTFAISSGPVGGSTLVWQVPTYHPA